MKEIIKHGKLFEKTDLEFENEGVYNPATIIEGDEIHLFYRAAHHGNYSTIGYATLTSALVIKNRHKQPIIFPEHDYEKQGTEDPRIVKIEDTFYLTYTAFDGKNASGALATSTDLQNFTKQGIIVPRLSFSDYKECLLKCEGLDEKYLKYLYLLKNRLGLDEFTHYYMWDKDVIYFPRKINGKFAFLHRLFPSIQIVYYDELADLTEAFWKDYISNLTQYVVINSKYPFEGAYLGGGCPPIETEEGWLIIYHGVENTNRGNVYHAAAALMDINDPTKEISRLDEPLFSPDLIWEKEGLVNNVVFPTGAIVENGELYMYYGASDSHIAVASIKLSVLMQKLTNK